MEMVKKLIPSILIAVAIVYASNRIEIVKNTIGPK